VCSVTVEADQLVILLVMADKAFVRCNSVHAGAVGENGSIRITAAFAAKAEGRSCGPTWHWRRSRPECCQGR
jgi:hypothetical protein